MNSLLYPRYRSLQNQIRRLDRSGIIKVLAACLFVVAVWVGLFVGLVYLLRFLYGVELLGPYLVDRLLTLLLFSFFGILLLSNIVTSLAIYYLSDELMLINAAPVSKLRLFYAKFAENLVASSWMVMVFGVPVILAYGTVHQAPVLYYLIAALVALCFVTLPATVGVAATTVLVNIFPARAARDLFIIITAVFIGGAWILFRMLRPEILVHPEAFSSLAEFLSSFNVPQSQWLPSTWATAVLAPAMRGQLGAVLSPLAYLMLWSASFVVLCAWLTSALYLGGWSRSQEGRPARLKGLAGSQLQRLASKVLGQAGGAVVAKDIKILVRDPTQWSQLVLLLALVAIYLFSIYALPFDALEFDTQAYRNSVSFINIGMTGFVQAAVAARFVYPSISAEGRGIWILRTAPAAGSDVVRAKWFSGAVPILIFGLVLAISSNVLLRTDDVIRWIAIADSILTGVAVCALAAGFGAMMPDFKAENAAKAAASFGGLVYMAVALVFITSIIVLQAYPTYRLLVASYFDVPLTRGFYVVATSCFAATVLITALVCFVMMRKGALALDQREY